MLYFEIKSTLYKGYILEVTTKTALAALLSALALGMVADDKNAPEWRLNR